MKRSELKIVINIADIGVDFEKMEQYCAHCQFIMRKIKAKIEEAAVESVWDKKERRAKVERRKEEKN